MHGAKHAKCENKKQVVFHRRYCVPFEKWSPFANNTPFTQRQRERLGSGENILNDHPHIEPLRIGLQVPPKPVRQNSNRLLSHGIAETDSKIAERSLAVR